MGGRTREAAGQPGSGDPEALKAQQSQAQEPPDDVVPTEAQHNGFGGERSPGEMSEPCPQGEAKGMKRGMTMGGISL